MNLNTLLDASMAFEAILYRLHSAISFGDSILAHRVARHQNSKLTKPLTELIAVYRSHNLKHHILNLKRDLVKQDPAFFSSANKSQIENLMRQDALNFSKPANVLHILLNTLNSNKSQQEKSAELKAVLLRVDGFRDAAERALAIVDKLKNIACKYTTKVNHQGCRKSTKGEVELFRKKYIRVFGTVYVLDKSEAFEPRKETIFRRKDNFSGDNRVPQKSTMYERSSLCVNNKKSCPSEPKKNPNTTPQACDDKKTNWHAKPREKTVAKGSPMKARREVTVFISFCDLDKRTMAIPLHARLTKNGISSFCGKQSLIPGEDVRDARNRALKSAAVFVFILSPEFAFRETNQEELSCALKRLKYAKKNKTARPILLPVYHRMTTEEANNGLFDLQAPRKQYSTNSRGSCSSTSLVTVCRKEGYQDRVERGEAKFADVRKLFEELDGIADVGPGLNSANTGTPDAAKTREEILSLTEKAVKSALYRINNQ